MLLPPATLPRPAIQVPNVLLPPSEMDAPNNAFSNIYHHQVLLGLAAAGDALAHAVYEHLHMTISDAFRLI